jgi:hypothetical protein
MSINEVLGNVPVLMLNYALLYNQSVKRDQQAQVDMRKIQLAQHQLEINSWGIGIAGNTVALQASVGSSILPSSTKQKENANGC